MEIRTIPELKKQLESLGSLKNVLEPEQFAHLGAVADTIAQELGELKPTQTRRIFTTIKQLEQHNRGRKEDEALESEDRTRLTLLEPELAYAVGRKLIPQDFFEVLKLCLCKDKMSTVGDLKRLVEFLSAVIAYQKFRGTGKSRKD
mgnify:CR=1 FL=1